MVMDVGREGAREAYNFWRELGADVEWGDFARHDYYVTRTIALSYAVGLALARIYAEAGEEVIKYGAPPLSTWPPTPFLCLEIQTP